MQDQCIFCKIDKKRIVDENSLSFAIIDTFPVSEGHTLIIPKRHESDYFLLTEKEKRACSELLQRARLRILATDPLVKGFNVGINIGEVAGQTIFHCHIHLIPRRKGDTANPRGGVRHVIAHKGNYPKP
ncbi:MAG TPA: HIT family protein [Spirochaetales bacterium]|jgi:diadenosine tetraphosphate (Ap4A) HIT family hydrolase|nr:HIT family protein [Spirochaetales bacterium]